MLTVLLTALSASQSAGATEVGKVQRTIQAQSVPAALRSASLRGRSVSTDTVRVANWISSSGDNVGAGFIIIDKRQASLHIFGPDAGLLGSSPVLLGSATGDESVPGIGLRPTADVQPHERTTPAGRFVAERGRNLRGEDVVWIDYDAAVSIHRVLTTNPKERRLERLATLAPDDNRISYGCVNVPTAFYEMHVRPLFAQRRAIVYVLPDDKPLERTFSFRKSPTRTGVPTAGV